MQRILDVHPEIAACDLHPDYASTRYAEDRTGLQLVRVQHHHAHIVSCMAENHILDPVIGLAFDGTGYGPDGTIWGGEILIARPGRFDRVAHLGCVPMPGGDAAVKEPWRMGVSYLQDAFGSDFENMDLPFLKDLPGMKIQIMREMMAGGINAPSTSSMGRLFDAVAAITGVRNRVFWNADTVPTFTFDPLRIREASTTPVMGMQTDAKPYLNASSQCKAIPDEVGAGKSSV